MHLNRQIPLVDLPAQIASIRDELDEAIRGVLDRGVFILDEEVERFERQFADYCGTRWAVGVASGMAALDLSLRACGIGPGDEVITVPNTFQATVLAVHHVGATPVLVDVDEQTGLMDPIELLSTITSRTRAILPVHLYGQSADMDAILQIARRHELITIEDACQAHGAAQGGARVGGFGQAGCFSFYPVKNLGGLGDGGMVTTNSDQVREDLVRLRNYGQTRKNYSQIPGYNERLDTIQAAILQVKLRRLDRWNAARQQNAAHYHELLAGLPIERPVTLADREHAWHLYVIRTERRDELATFLAERGVVTGVHYPTPIHRQPAFAGYEFANRRFPIAERLAGKILSLPMYPELTLDQIQYVADAVRAFFSRSSRRTEQLAPVSE